MARVLVIDREEAPSRDLASVFESHGHQVDRVADTPGAYASIKKHLPEVILIDLMEVPADEPDAQPEGIKLLAQLYLDHPEIPLVIYTDCEVYREHFWSWSAAAHLKKQAGPKAAVKAVEELTRQKPS